MKMEHKQLSDGPNETVKVEDTLNSDGKINGDMPIDVIDHSVDLNSNDIINSNEKNDLNDLKQKSVEIYKQLTCIYKGSSNLSKNTYQNLSNITQLDLTNSNFNNLPLSIIYCSNLESLILDGNYLPELPKDLYKIVTLKELSLAKSYLEDIPKAIFDCKNLEVLNLAHNKLEYLPMNCTKLEKLKTLNISGNLLKCMPKCIQMGLPNLEILDVSENEKMNLNGRVLSNNLKKLIAKNNGVIHTAFPEWIFNTKIIEFDEINFENSCFEVIQFRQVLKKIRIKTLSLQQCYLNNKLLRDILKHVEIVNCLKIGNKIHRARNNSFTTFPDRINQPESLREVKIDQVGLSSISRHIQSFKNLMKLEVQNNSLSWLPDEFCNLKHLEILILNSNSLVMLPENIGQMISLKILDASNNSISTIPNSICHLKHIKFIDFYNNNLIELPAEINGLESLKGLDLEQNRIDTADLKLPASFESLRNQLWKYNHKIKNRLVGPVIVQVTPDDSPDQSYCSDSYSSSSRSLSSQTTSKRNSENALDDWSNEYDSADEFDPFNPPTVPEYTCRRYVLYDRMAFCPADIHPRRIKEILAEKIVRGMIPPIPAIVEGQFDDAD